MANDPKFMVDCFLCERPFQFGPHIYSGRPIQGWGVTFCLSCIRGNHDGIVTDLHPRLVAHLEKEGIPVHLNAKGWLDIPGAF